jgi:DNA transposition AAA+ family ATPase
MSTNNPPQTDLAVTPTLSSPGAGDNVRASWRHSLQDLQSNCAQYQEEDRKTLVDAFLWCVNGPSPMRFQTFCERVGYQSNTVDRILRGRYVGEGGKTLPPPPKLLKAIRNLLALEKERALGGSQDFVLTPTAKKIHRACALARESQTPVFLWGPSHIGKTWALERFAAENNHGRTIYIRMQAASGLGGMVRTIARSLGISDKSNTANLLDYIKNGVTQDMLLIIDEVHLLQYTYRLASFFGCMEVLREIHDRTHCGMVLCGTKLLLDKLRQGEHKEMEQIMRRGVHRTALPSQPTPADVKAIVEHWGLDFPDKKLLCEVDKRTEQPYAILRQIGKRDGLKAITERLRYARKLASKRKQKVAWIHFCQAHLIIEDAATEEAPTW